MLNALPAIAAFLLMRRFQVPQGENAGLTAVAAITPGALGLAPAIVAAGVARQGGGDGSGSSLFGGRRVRPMRRRFTVPSPPAPDNAPSVVTVPDVVGMTFSEAQRALGANLIAGRFDVHSADKREHVIDQDIPAGRRVDAQTMVGLTVSLGPAPAPPVDQAAEIKAIDSVKRDVDDLRTETQARFTTLQTDIADQLGTMQKAIIDAIPKASGTSHSSGSGASGGEKKS